jgi:hypothetical protein
MSQYVTDTHTLHWHLTSNPRLSPKVRQLLTDADAGYTQNGRTRYARQNHHGDRIPA